MQQTRKRTPLGWQRIADTAIAVADEIGLERLSLRAVAERLDVTPMALYKHIRNKTELEAIVSAEILDRSMRLLDFAPGTPWREVIREGVMEMHRAFQLRPAMLHIFIQYPYHPKSQRLGGQLISALQGEGFSLTRARQLFAMLSVFVVGTILVDHHYAKGRTSSGFDRARRDALLKEPAIAKEITMPGPMRFEDMLELQLDLIETEIARNAPGKEGTRGA